MRWSGMLTGRNLVRSLAGVLGVIASFAFLYLPLSSVTIYLIFATLVALGIGLYASERKRSRVRAEAQAFASLSDWTYQENLSGLFAGLRTPPFDATEMTYTQVVTGRFGGYECFDGLFEWSKRIEGDNYITGSHRIAAVRLPDELPRLMLVPEGVGARLAKALGGADIDFESSTFNRSWRVLADDPKVAYEMLNPRVLSKLEAVESKAPLLFERGLGLRIDDDSKGIDSLAERLGGIVAVARFLPQHTIEDYGRRANSIGPLPSTATPGALTHGYNAAMQEADAEHQRTAKPHKQQKWIDAARTGESPDVPPQDGP
jgi:hypothetical protein